MFSRTSLLPSGKEIGMEKERGYEDTVTLKEKNTKEMLHKSHVSDTEAGGNNNNNNNDDDDDDSDWNELVSDTEDTVLNQLHKDSKQQTKRKKPLGPMKLCFKCEWKNCSYETEEESKFHVHVSYHIPDLEIKTLGNGEEVYLCLWAECNYMTGGVKEIQRHVTYHSYHTKLKNIGAKIVEEWNLPKCTYDNDMRNIVPDKISPMVCEWNKCFKEFNNVQVFLQHIQMHVNYIFNDSPETRGNIRCKWDGCILTTLKKIKTSLTEHLRTHTQEKVVGCPTCGHLFSTNTKLIDHLERQTLPELSEFQCSHCYKQYPSMRLLKDHMRGHVNFYKCCYCDMTCTSRHTFSAHIRYKHLDSKPFKCNSCEYECKTQYDLKKHLASHDSKLQFECEESGCEFTCRSKHTLQRHMIDDHNIGNSPVYACHLSGCKSSYKRGCYLTTHLMTKHCLRWPSGHSKFMYHREADGIYRLQTVRYESVKLCEENKSSSVPLKSKFKLSPQPGKGARSFKVSTVDSESENSTSQVLISIEDESGNTITCCTASEVVADTIPKNAMIIASADETPQDI